MIRASVTGNVSEPKLEFGKSGKARLKFTIAVNHGYFDKQTNQWTETGTTFLRATLWEHFAEQTSDWLTKGMKVIASGRIETRAFTTNEGTEATSLEIQVDEIGQAGRKRAPQGSQQRGGGFGGGQTYGGDPWGGQPSSSGGGWDQPPSDPAPF